MKTKEQIKEQIQEVQSKIDFMIGYMQIKMKSQDWHAVEDAGSDIRDLEAEKDKIAKARQDMLDNDEHYISLKEKNRKILKTLPKTIKI